MKKFVCALLFLFAFAVCLGFVPTSHSCAKFQTNAFRIIRQASDSGQIVVSYVFPINSVKMAELGVQEKDVLSYKFYLTTYVNTLAKSSKSRECEGVAVSNCLFFEELDGIGYSIAFEDVESQKKYFKTTEDEKSSSVTQKSKGFFVKTTYLQTEFPISSQETADSVRAVCEYALSSWAKNENVSNNIRAQLHDYLSEAVFIYDFASQQTSLKSDAMYQDDFFVHNVFSKTYDQLKNDNKIVFWVSSPNKPIWYASALILVVFAMAVAFVVVKVKKNSKKFA